MELEEAIKQKKFRSEHEKMMVNIIYTNGWLGGQQVHLFKPYGLSQQQYNILRILRGQHPDPASVSLLMDRMLDKMSNASRLVEKLRQKDLVSRQECKHDRRQVDVLITEKGLATLEEIDAQLEQVFEGMSTLTIEEAQEVNRLLDKLRG
ncbi:MAG: MarR family winged helix-turn-helix transcriptional regulator [Salibacteraceae bacterium]